MLLEVAEPGSLWENITHPCCPSTLSSPSPPAFLPGKAPEILKAQAGCWEAQRLGRPGGYALERPAGSNSRGRSLHFPFSLFCRRHPVEWLDRQTFSFHFRNLRFANGRNYTYLCYQVERLKHCSPDSSDWGVFQNWVWAPGHSHRRRELSVDPEKRRSRETQKHLSGALELQCGEHRFRSSLRCVPPQGKKPGRGRGRVSANCGRFRMPCTSCFPNIMIGRYNYNCNSLVFRVYYVRY